MAAFWAALPRDPAERKGLSRRSLDRQVVFATLTRHLQFPRFGAENAEEKEVRSSPRTTGRAVAKGVGNSLTHGNPSGWLKTIPTA